MRSCTALLLLALGWPLTTAAQTRPPARGPSAGPSLDGPLVETAPLRCWWRASKGAILVGEPFDVRLTCAVLETDTVQVVPDETRLTVASVPLTPFEVTGGEHPADTRTGDRRFFQYRYQLRLLDANEIGHDVSLPRLPILYKVQSRVAADTTLAGRDFTYLMPPLTVRVLSQVPDEAFDIRDGADVGLERVEALRFRARMLDIGAGALGILGGLLGVLALVAIVARARPAAAADRTRVSEARALAAAATELARVARMSAGGWTPELIAAAHAAVRIVGAVALGRRLSEQPLHAARSQPDARLAVRGWLPGQRTAAISSPTTPADLAAALRALPEGAAPAQRAGLEALQTALATFTAAQFGAGDTPLDSLALSSAVEAGRTEAERLARTRRWDGVRRAARPAWRAGELRR